MKSSRQRYAVDNSAILYLALVRKYHTNVYRFSMKLYEAVDPEILQLAVDRIYKRFPTIIAGFQPGFFHYSVIPAKEAPTVQLDPGCLITMSAEELRSCAYRVYYCGNQISIEAFHALTDGYGALATFTTMVAEYLRLKHRAQIPACNLLVDLCEAPAQHELTDEYLVHQKGKPLHITSRYAYQLPGKPNNDWRVMTSCRSYPTKHVLDAAHRYGVSATALFSGIMASSIMEIQKMHLKDAKHKPVRIMVPVDLRRMFGSRTLRNFILYALPTMEPQDSDMTLRELLESFHAQLQKEIVPDRMASIMAYNVRSQFSWLFRMIPRAVKCSLMRLIYHYFGESNSCITLTNLGNLKLPREMEAYVQGIEVILTPRARSPYNCALISYGDELAINISRFCDEPELEDIFFRKLELALSEN